MKILISTPIWPPEAGGPATYTKRIAEKLRNEHEITVATFSSNPEFIDGARIIAVSKNYPLPLRLFIFFVRILTLARKADIVYVQNAMVAGAPSVLAARWVHKPVIIKYVGDGAWERAFGEGKTKKFLDDFLNKPDAGFNGRLRIWIQKITLSRADKIIVPSEYLKKVLVEHYDIPEKRIITVYNASDTESENEASSRNIPTAGNSNHRVLAVARLVSWKGVDGIIKAVKIAEKIFPDITLTIAGDGPEMEKLKKLATELSLENKVKFLGNVSRKETAALRRQSQVFVLNSVYEGLPHSALSSFSAGIPVIATDIPGTNEAVINEKTGLTVPPDDPPALARAIERIFTDSELADRLTLNAKSFLQERFSWDGHMRKLLEILHSLLPKPGN